MIPRVFLFSEQHTHKNTHLLLEKKWLITPGQIDDRITGDLHWLRNYPWQLEWRATLAQVIVYSIDWFQISWKSKTALALKIYWIKSSNYPMKKQANKEIIQINELRPWIYAGKMAQSLNASVNRPAGLNSILGHTWCMERKKINTCNLSFDLTWAYINPYAHKHKQ